MPEGFKVLIKELQSLALNVRVLSDEEKDVIIEDIDYDMNEQEKARELGLELPGMPLGNNHISDDVTEVDEEIEEEDDEEQDVLDDYDVEADTGFEDDLEDDSNTEE